MALQSYFKELMDINRMEDNEEKAQASRSLFKKLNDAPLPDQFNWVEEVFEGIHVKERGGLTALLWVNIDTDEERRYSYSELAGKGNQILNLLRKEGVRKGESVYMMIPSVPETWFTSLATVKGGMVSVPTAMTMTVRELEYRFETFAPQAILADKDSAPLIDEALANVGAAPKVKIILGEREGWKSYSETDRESKDAEFEKTKPSDIVLCFFTSGTTGRSEEHTSELQSH